MLKKQKFNILDSFKPLDNQAIFIVFCLLYGLAAILFSNERVIFLDNALHIYNSILNNEIGIMAGRWPISIVRVPLFIGIHFNLPLTTLILLYSLSHATLVIAIGLIIKSATNQENLFLFLFTYLLVIGHTFFWCVSEIIPAILLTCLLLGSKRTWLLLAFALIVVIIFSHPQAILALTFLFSYEWIIKNQKESLILLMFSPLCYLLKSKIFTNWYDTMKMGVLKDGLKENPFQFIEYDSLRSFLEMESVWMISFLCFVLVMVYLLFNKSWKESFLYVSFCIGTLYLFIMSNPNHISSFYAESNMYLISFFSGIVIIDKIKQPSTLNMILISILAISVIRVLYLSDLYSNRLLYVTNLTNKLTHKKNIIQKNQVDEELLQLEWGLPFETLIISSKNKQSLSKTLVALDKKEIKKHANSKKLLNGMGGYFEIPSDDKYFDLDTSVYKVIKLKGGPERK